MEIVEELTALGFSPHAARVYVALLRQPAATGYEVARVAGLPRANVYQVLAGLLASNAIQLVGDAPARYVAHPPTEVLGRIKREVASRCDALLPHLRQLAPPAEPAAFWTVHGEVAVRERVVAMIAEAGGRVAISLWADDLVWARGPLLRAHGAGCQVIVNLFGQAALDFGEVYQHEEPAKVVGGHLLTLVVDSAAALTAALDEPAGAISTEHPALVRLVEKLVRDEAYLAAIFERFRPELEAAYGPHLVALRQRLLPADQARRLLTVVGFGATDGDARRLLGEE
jgi:HTH-type transcriptional regulator, sugar sensing transcriptional regulator